MEMELKLLVDPAAVHLVERHPAFCAVEPRTHQALTTYYDTPDFALYRMGASLRVRCVGEDYVQTVKLDGSGHAIGTRGEWEWPLGSAALDVAALASLPAEAAAIRELAGRAAPLFVTDIERTARLLRFEDGTAIEAVIDRGTIAAGPRSLPIDEIELELKQGAVAPVFRLAIELAERADLRYGPQSKAERGYALLSDRLPERPVVPFLGWSRDVTIGDALPRLVHAALRELAAEIPDASAGVVEGVHRMRAAIRKLRSILVLFRPYLERRAAARFNTALRDLGGVLGAGRDWDVFLTETLARVEAGEGGADASLLRRPAEHRRDEARAAVAEAMRGHAPTDLILGMGLWTAEPGWLRKARPGTPLADLVPDLLDDLDRKARKRAKTLDLDATEELHALRKSLKKLRYSIEYVGSLFGHHAVDRHLHAIKDVLGALGDINDAAVTEQRLADLVPDHRTDLAPAAAVVSRETAGRRTKAIGKLPKKLRRLHEIEPFWA